METFEVCRKITDLGKYGSRTLVYSMIEDEFPDVDGTFTKQYGIMIKIEENGEQTAVRGITTVSEKAVMLLDALASNFVTPVTLGDVVYDWLSV